MVIFQDLNMDAPSTPKLTCSNEYCPNAPYVRKYRAMRIQDAVWKEQKNIEQELLIKEMKNKISSDIIKYILDNHFRTWSTD